MRKWRAVSGNSLRLTFQFPRREDQDQYWIDQRLFPVCVEVARIFATREDIERRNPIVEYDEPTNWRATPFYLMEELTATTWPKFLEGAA